MNAAEARLQALEAYEIMDTPPEQAFDDLTYLTTFICETPIALVTLLDTHRQWFKSAVGVTVSESPIELAFCTHAIQQEKVLLVRDASQDPRFSDNVFVTGEPHIRFYAGAPLVTPSGVPLGTICALDRVPRDLSERQQQALAALARQVIWAMELRKTLKELRLAIAEKEAAQSEVATLQKMLPMCAWCRKVRDDESFWSNVEHYLMTHSNLRFTHGICPVCAEGLIEEIGARRSPVLPASGG
jgi:GAF domain-containing protein